MKRFVKKNPDLEKEILKLVNVDDRGMIVYDGPGPESERTGSPIRLLIQWYLYREGEKPLDFDIFKEEIKTIKRKKQNKKNKTRKSKKTIYISPGTLR